MLSTELNTLINQEPFLVLQTEFEVVPFRKEIVILLREH